MKTCFFILTLCCLVSCKTGSSRATLVQTDCISRVIAIDDSLGKIRNRECENLSLSQTIANYTKGMAAIDTKGCPEAFSKAYRSHKDAWNAVLPVTDTYPDLRGEMHVLFKELERSKDSVEFKKLQADIWTTWGEVERFVKK
ncbi:hypothetical protein [Flavobacterium limnosediminis]|nr:hypothetical protein [Flavobacterium limnosediminis]